MDKQIKSKISNRKKLAALVKNRCRTRRKHVPHYVKIDASLSAD